MKTNTQPPASVIEAERVQTASDKARCASATGSEILRCAYCEKTSEDIDPNSLERAVISTTYQPSNSCVVQCNWCGLSGPIFGTIDEAIEAWQKLTLKSPNDELTR